MKINNYSPNFKSRNIEIRQADRICRLVNSEFASISSSKLAQKIKHNPELGKYIKYDRRLSENLHTRIRKKVLLIKDDIIEKYKKLAELVKKERLANCDELMRLASLVCAANGIKTQPIIVQKYSYKTLDTISCQHIALALIPKGKLRLEGKMSNFKDTIIIDPWLGIADYASNVSLKYKNVFPQFLNLKEDDVVLLTPVLDEIKDVITERNFQDIKKEFPEYVIGF